MRIVKLEEIKKILKNIDIIPAIEKGFSAYSSGNTIIPPVGELIFKDPPGDVHIKYGYIVNHEYYVIKIASGFYENPKINLSSSNGLMLLFRQKTGNPCAILLDEGYLSGLRTAAAGAIVAKYLAPKNVDQIGIIGTGTQARLQLQYVYNVISCKNVMIFGRDDNKLLQFKTEMKDFNLNIKTTKNINDITSSCNFIVTTTPAKSPLLFAEQIRKGTHITAIGADSAHKQELDENIFEIADVVVVDSIDQCINHGDTAHAIRKNVIDKNELIELGNIILGKSRGRAHEDEITIADLTGLAVQDIQIAKTVFEGLNYFKPQNVHF